MLGSVLVPTKPPGLRRNTYTTTSTGPPLPPRRSSLSTTPAAKTAAKTAPPVPLKKVALVGGMESSRYTRPSSPRAPRYSNPGRSSTGTFTDPYYDPAYYGRPSSPRSSVDRLGSSSLHAPYFTPTTSSHTRSSSLKYDPYTGRPRRNTNELRPASSSSTALPTTTLPLHTPYSSHTSHSSRPKSPLPPSYGPRASDTYITPGSAPSRSSHSSNHKKVYSVDDSSHSTKLVAEVEPSRHHRDTTDRGYSITSGGRSYHDSKPPARLTDLGNDGYSYTDPASMYRDTEPAWRRPRAGSLERGARPTSMISDRPPRASTRELGPPPSTRGFDKINNVPRPQGRSSSIERAREIPKYDPYPDTGLSRSSSSRTSRAPAVHQEPPRRETYRDDYSRSHRDVENKRHSTAFEDRDVPLRGFGIAPGIAPVNPSPAYDHHAIDRQPPYAPPEPARPRQYESSNQYAPPEPPRPRPHESSNQYPPTEPPRPRPHESNNQYPPVDPTRSRQHEPKNQYYPSERVEPRMPEPRPEPRASRDAAPPQDNYETRRDRDNGRHESKAGFVPAAAGAAAGVAATLGGAAYMKSRDKGSDRDSSTERERERRKEYDERDRRDRPDERRERKSEKRSSYVPPPAAPAAAPIAPAPVSTPVGDPEYPPTEPDRKHRDRRYEEEDRERSSRKAPSPEGSGDERPRHYVDRDAEHRRDPAPAENNLDPDEEYRRRVQQEAERSSRSTHKHDSDSDREKERRRRKDEREQSREPADRSRASPPRETPNSRYDERSASTYEGALVQEPESLDRSGEHTSKSVQIVTPPKDPLPPVKGILRKPTEKFPEDPEPIREGVAPHKDALKGKDIPVGARWTRIDRRLVNPEALEQAKERFEERMDCVIVLRVLTKEEIQKLADRTKKIRENRDDEYDHERRDRSDRDKRSHRSKDEREDEDRDGDRERHRERRRRYDDESDYDEADRRERDKSKRLEIEAPR